MVSPRFALFFQKEKRRASNVTCHPIFDRIEGRIVCSYLIVIFSYLPEAGSSSFSTLIIKVGFSVGSVGGTNLLHSRLHSWTRNVTLVFESSISTFHLLPILFDSQLLTLMQTFITAIKGWK